MVENFRVIDVEGEKRKIFFNPKSEGPYPKLQANYVRYCLLDKTSQNQEAFYFGHIGHLILACNWDQTKMDNPNDAYQGGVRFSEVELSAGLEITMANRRAEEFDRDNHEHIQKMRRGYDLVDALLVHINSTSCPVVKGEIEALEKILDVCGRR